MVKKVINDPWRTFSPFAVVQISDDQFFTGDSLLREVTVSLGEGKKSSKCSFSIFDKEGKFADKYFFTSIAQGGLQLPDEFFEQPQQNSTPVSSFTEPGSEASGPSAPGSSYSIALRGQKVVAKTRDRGTISLDRSDIQAIAKSAKKIGLDPSEYLAIMMFESEVDPSVQNGGGYTGLIQFGRATARGLGTSTEALRKMTIQQQLPWVEKYFTESATNFSPNHDATHLYACVLAGDCNRINAKDSNGTSASNATPALKRLRQASAEMIQKAGVASYTPKETIAQASSQTSTEAPKKETTTTEVSNKGTQITIAFSITPERWEVYSFYHTGTEFSGSDNNVLTFEGLSIRGLMETRIINQKFTNITLKELAAYYCKQNGVKLKMDFAGPKYPVITQTGNKTDRLMLLELVQAAGLYMYDDGPNLIIKRNPAFEDDQPLGFVLRHGELLDKITIREKAQMDVKSASQDDERNRPQLVESKTKVDSITGHISQLAVENKKGLPTGRKASTGQNTYTSTYKGSYYGIQSFLPPVEKDHKGYTLETEFTTTQAALALQPLQAFYIEGYIKFAEQRWFIESVSHKYSRGAMRTSISAYIPIKGTRTTQQNDTLPASYTEPGVYGKGNKEIYEAALAYRGTSTANFQYGGNVACVFAVNNVLKRAGIKPPWGSAVNVDAVDAAMKSGRGQRINSIAEAQPGDIITIGSGRRAHTGIYIGNGKALSNSSSKESFTWESDINFSPSYSGLEPRIYRIKS